jgi:four helix bundle protein
LEFAVNGQTGRRASGQRKSFRQQILWKKAQDFADSIATVVADLPRDLATNVIANQTLRSATSIAANIAEGYGRFSQAAYRNHLSIARGSAFETESWLDLLLRRGLISQDEFNAQLAACDELESLLTLRMKSLSDGKSYAVREEEVAYEV